MVRKLKLISSILYDFVVLLKFCLYDYIYYAYSSLIIARDLWTTGILWAPHKTTMHPIIDDPGCMAMVSMANTALYVAFFESS